MRFVRVLAPLALAGTLLAGCGGDANDGTTGGAPQTSAPADNGVADLEADAIVDKAIKALDTAKSYSLKGDITDEDGTIGLDFKISGKDILGTMTLGGAEVELLRADGQTFMRPDEDFWKQNAGDEKAGAALAELVGDRWAKVEKDDKDFQEFFQIAEPAKLLDPEGEIDKGETKTIEGVSTIALEEKSKDGGTLYVATTGEPYPMLLEGSAGEGQITFADFGTRFDDIKVPAETDVADLDDLQTK